MGPGLVRFALVGAAVLATAGCASVGPAIDPKPAAQLQHQVQLVGESLSAKNTADALTRLAELRREVSTFSASRQLTAEREAQILAAIDALTADLTPPISSSPTSSSPTSSSPPATAPQPGPSPAVRVPVTPTAPAATSGPGAPSAPTTPTTPAPTASATPAPGGGDGNGPGGGYGYGGNGSGSGNGSGNGGDNGGGKGRDTGGKHG